MDLHTARGFTLLEILFVVLITMTVAAIAIPMSGNALGFFRLSGDARSVSNAVAVTKMRAAADFTRARLFVDLSGNRHRLETFAKPGSPAALGCPMGVTSCWLPRGGWTNLSQGISLGFGTLATPPANTQTTIGQAPACRDDAGAAIANTGCLVFNSRGVPVDAVTLAPTADDAVYLTDDSAGHPPTAVYAATVAASGMIQTWRSGPATANWVRQ